MNMSGPVFDNAAWDKGYEKGHEIGLLKGKVELYEFAKLFLDPEMYGHSCTAEVRDHARRIMGIPAMEMLEQMGGKNGETGA